MNKLPEETSAEDDIREYLVFAVNSIDFGIDISLVQEIIQIQPIYKIPNSIKACRGIINMRGTIVPVIDMRLKLGYEAAEYNEKTCIVVISVQSDQIGMIVDMVKDVIRISPDELSSTPTIGSEIKNSGLISNMATVDGEIKEILDVYSVFDISI